MTFLGVFWACFLFFFLYKRHPPPPQKKNLKSHIDHILGGHRLVIWRSSTTTKGQDRCSMFQSCPELFRNFFRIFPPRLFPIQDSATSQKGGPVCDICVARACADVRHTNDTHMPSLKPLCLLCQTNQGSLRHQRVICFSQRKTYPPLRSPPLKSARKTRCLR